MLEGTWKAAQGEERELWRGLAQLAVGLTHLRRGNVKGGAALLERGAGRLAAFTDHPPYDVDVAGLRAWALDVVERVRAADGRLGEGATPPEVQPPPRLRRD